MTTTKHIVTDGTVRLFALVREEQRTSADGKLKSHIERMDIVTDPKDCFDDAATISVDEFCELLDRHKIFSSVRFARNIDFSSRIARNENAIAW